jgi:hypothetical protein
MANYNKSFNFRNGVQVDNDNFVVNANGLVGIGTTIPKDYLLNVYGDVRVTGLVTTKSLDVSELNIGIATVTSLNVGNISISSGIITATSGIVTYYGDGSKLTNMSTSQWIDVDPGPFVLSIYAAGNVGIATTFPSFALQIGGNPNFSNGIGINSVGGVYASGIITAANFSGGGSLLSNINANNISSGTLSTSRLPIIPNQNLPSNISVSGIITAQTRFVGNVTGNVNSSGVSTFSGGIIGNVTGNVNSSGVSTFSGGIIGNVTGNVNSSGVSTFSGGIIGNVTGDLIGIASTARNLTSDARVNIQHLESQTSTIGVSTISTRLGVSGNIGVNTDSPQADIHIVNSSNTSLHLTGNQSTITLGRNLDRSENSGGLKFGNTSGLYPYSNTRTLDIVNYDTGNLNYYLHYGSAGVGTGNFNWIYTPNGSNPLMTLTYEGNLGIGVTNPTNKLQVFGSAQVSSLTITNDLYVSNTINADITGTASTSTNVSGGTIDAISAYISGITTSIGGFFGDLTGNVVGNSDSATTSTNVFGGNVENVEFVGIATTSANSNEVLYVNGDSIFAGNVSISGILTANTFIGDGSGLTGVVGTGSGVEIRSNDSPVGTAATINFRNNLTVDFSNGVATIDSTGGTGGSGESYWSSTSAGIHTLSKVGIGTTNPTSALTVKGNTSLETLNVFGVSTFAGAITATSSITLNSTSAERSIGFNNGSTNIYFYGLTSADRSGHVGMFDGTNNRYIWRYYPTNDSFIFDRIVSITDVPTSTTLTGTPSQKLQVTGGAYISGNLGIGKTNPQYKLDVAGTTLTNQLSVGVGGSIIHTNEYGVGIGTTADTSALVIGGGQDKLLVRGRIRSFGPYSEEEGIINGISVGSDRETIKGLLIYDDGNTPSGIVEKGVKLTAVDESLKLMAGVGNYNNYNSIIINKNGVGIGTTNPTSKLTVYDGSFAIQSPGKNPLDISQLVDNTWIIRTFGNDTISIAPNNTKRLTANNSGVVVSGILTATSFVGDGSGLTNLPSGGSSGVSVQDNTSLIGTATTINFGTGLSVSSVSAGIVTVTAIPTNNFYDGGIVTGNITLTSVNKNQLIAVSTGSSISINLPAGSGLSAGDGFTFVDVGSSETSSGNASTFNITINPNGSDRILGGSGPLIIDENGASVKLVWMGSTYDWRIV